MAKESFVDGLASEKARWDVHGVYVPEDELDMAAETARLRAMDERDCVNIFISEGAGVETIVKEMEAAGEDVPRDAFGHVKLDAVNPGKWFASQFAEAIGAEKGFSAKVRLLFARRPSQCPRLAVDYCLLSRQVQAALARQGGVVGHDEERGDLMRPIEFPRIAGGKPFNTSEAWYQDLLQAIGQK